MVDSLWFVLALVLLAVVSVALVLVLVLQREEAHCGRETRTEYLQPNYGETGGFRVSSAPSNETIIPYRYWLIEGQVSEIDYDIVPGRRMSLRTARTGQMLYPVGFFDLAFEDVQQYDIDGVTVTQRRAHHRYIVDAGGVRVPAVLFAARDEHDCRAGGGVCDEYPGGGGGVKGIAL